MASEVEMELERRVNLSSELVASRFLENRKIDRWCSLHTVQMAHVFLRLAVCGVIQTVRTTRNEKMDFGGDFNPRFVRRPKGIMEVGKRPLT